MIEKKISITSPIKWKISNHLSTNYKKLKINPKNQKNKIHLFNTNKITLWFFRFYFLSVPDNFLLMVNSDYSLYSHYFYFPILNFTLYYLQCNAVLQNPLGETKEGRQAVFFLSFRVDIIFKTFQRFLLKRFFHKDQFEFNF